MLSAVKAKKISNVTLPPSKKIKTLLNDVLFKIENKAKIGETRIKLSKEEWNSEVLVKLERLGYETTPLGQLYDWECWVDWD